MTPRALVASGRVGVGGEIFPETALETGRRVALEPGLVTILRYQDVPDGGGDVTKSWIRDLPSIRGRIMSVRRLPKTQLIGGKISEEGMHLVWLDPDVSVTTEDRLEIEETKYKILSVEPVTAGAFLRLEVKGL